jgi:hypothetical protein
MRTERGRKGRGPTARDVEKWSTARDAEKRPTAAVDGDATMRLPLPRVECGPREVVKAEGRRPETRQSVRRPPSTATQLFGCRCPVGSIEALLSSSSLAAHFGNYFRDFLSMPSPGFNARHVCTRLIDDVEAEVLVAH